MSDKNESQPISRRRVVITVALCFIMILFGLGMWAQKGLFVSPISSALGIDRSAYGFADTMRYIATALINIPFGYLINKFGSKKLILAGFIFLVLSALCYALAEGVVILYLGGFLLGVGLSWTGTALVGYIVNKVCSKNKGTIMGFILAANGIGGAIASIIVTPFIKMGDFGYRYAFYLMAGIFVFIFILILIFYKEPSGQTQVAKKNTRGENWVGIDFKRATKMPYFFGACVCIFFTGLILQGVTGIYAANMKDVGIDQDFISTVAVVSSIALACFKFFNGFMYDKCGLRTTITIDCISAIGVMIVLFFITNSIIGRILAVCYAILAAIALPLETVMIPIYAKDLFGEKSFNKILGIFVSINQVGYAISSPLINLCFDLTGSYKIALGICAGCMLLVIIGLQVVITSANKVKKQVVSEYLRKTETN